MRYYFLILWIYALGIAVPVKANTKDSISIYIFLLDECRICQEVAPELNEIYKQAVDAGIGFVGYFPNIASNEAGIQKFAKKYKVKYTLATDYQKEKARLLGATIMPEVVVYNETQKQVVYKGLINNLFYAPGKRRHRITEHYLKDIIFAVHQGITPTISQTEAIGCFINFSENQF